MVRKEVINIEVGLDDNHIPESIAWQSSDNPHGKEASPCKAMLLYLLEQNHLDTMRFEIWTKDMPVPEMNNFFFQTLKSLADTYFNSTKNNELASQMLQFAMYFGEKTGVIPNKEG